jgi:hypothetical protein
MVKRDGSMNGEDRSKELTTTATTSTKTAKPDHMPQENPALSEEPPVSPAGSRLGGVVKAHSDNLDKHISEVEASSASGVEGDASTSEIYLSKLSECAFTTPPSLEPAGDTGGSSDNAGFS